jgi:hypothetical protein
LDCTSGSFLTGFAFFEYFYRLGKSAGILVRREYYHFCVPVAPARTFFIIRGLRTNQPNIFHRYFASGMRRNAYFKVARSHPALSGKKSISTTDTALNIQMHSSFCKLAKIMSWWSFPANFTSFDAILHQVHCSMNRFCKDREHRPKIELYHAIPVLAGSGPLRTGPPKRPIYKLSTSRSNARQP